MNTKERATNREMTALVRNAAECLIKISPEILNISFTMAKIRERPVLLLAQSREEFAITNLESLKTTICEIENGEYDETLRKYIVQPRLNHKRAPHISLEAATKSLLSEGSSILENYSEQIYFVDVWGKVSNNDLLT